LGKGCPGYTEGVYTAAAHASASYRLNCRPVGTLAPQARATFAMRQRVPKNASLGLAKVGWNLDTPTGPGIGGTVEVLR
jgi:hypothetical protein